MPKDKDVITSLPLLPSTERQWKEKVKAEKIRADAVYGSLTRKYNGIILRATYLTTEQKEKLLAELFAV